MRVGERAFGTDDAVCDSRLGQEKRARDLVRGEPADQAQRERKLHRGTTAKPPVLELVTGTTCLFHWRTHLI